MNIYVGNLSYQLTEDELRDEFQKYGEVSTVNIIKDKASDRSKGFGFVEMPNEEEATKAIDGLNGVELKGRSVKVNEARPPKKREFKKSFIRRSSM